MFHLLVSVFLVVLMTESNPLHGSCVGSLETLAIPTENFLRDFPEFKDPAAQAWAIEQLFVLAQIAPEGDALLPMGGGHYAGGKRNPGKQIAASSLQASIKAFLQNPTTSIDQYFLPYLAKMAATESHGRVNTPLTEQSRLESEYRGLMAERLQIRQEVLATNAAWKRFLGKWFNWNTDGWTIATPLNLALDREFENLVQSAWVKRTLNRMQHQKKE